MEAKTLKNKKGGISKGKMKKTIKNVLCRPDAVFWPSISEEHVKILESALNKYKVDIPDYKKPHWKDIKNLPKEQRPKPPRIPKVEGFIFGLNDCKTAINQKHCSAIIIESTVKPRTIVLPFLEICVSNNVPFLCWDGLKSFTTSSFGIPTSCLGFSQNCPQDLKTTIQEVTKNYKPPLKPINKDENIEPMKTVKDIDHQVMASEKPDICPYLYRNSKKARVFNPSVVEKEEKAFVGQDFIKFASTAEQQPQTDRKTYMSMILKRIAGNQNRVKQK